MTTNRLIQRRHVYTIQTGMGESIATGDVVIHQDRSHWVTNLWVHPDHRQQGIARTILAQITSDWASVDLYLHISPYTDQPMDMRELHQFYSQWGFCDTDVPGIMRRLSRLPGGSR